MATAVEFDFETKQERSIPVDAARVSCEQGRYCWIDVDVTDRAVAETALRELGVNAVAIEEALDSRVDGRHDVYEDCLHIAVTATAFRNGQMTRSHVDVIIGERFLVTLHSGHVEFLDQVRRTYQKDFVKFAKTLSFLLYEIWDHLIESYTKLLRGIEDQVEAVQAEIFGQTDDEIFTRVATVTRELLSFRKIVLTAREVLHELAMRRSPFVSESTQPFLDNMVGKLERLGSDLAVEREILAETLSLYMGIVGHRTNRLISRLTVVSLVFLPLTFLCGVYGMNFDSLPELRWRYGYAYFWGLAALIASGLLVLAKNKRWL